MPSKRNKKKGSSPWLRFSARYNSSSMSSFIASVNAAAAKDLAPPLAKIVASVVAEMSCKRAGRSALKRDLAAGHQKPTWIVSRQSKSRSSWLVRLSFSVFIFCM
ncbi:hypothetical protein CF335_g1692 [Tilletia laevis]|nr:hypothetical protein CF335_g1692 [Tilletia laevis]